MKEHTGQKSGTATGHEQSNVDGAAQYSAKNLPRWKRIVFSLLPVCILLVAAEAVVRLKGLDDPKLRSLGLLEETAGIVGPDPDLFW